MDIVTDVNYTDFLKVKNSCFPDEWIDEEIFLTNLAREQYLFAVEDEMLLGYILFDDTFPISRLIQLCVDIQYRRRGVGKLLLFHLIDYLKSLHKRELRFYVDDSNVGAIEFYRLHGFTTYSKLCQYSIDLTQLPKSDLYVELSPLDTNNREEFSILFDLGDAETEYLMSTNQVLTLLVYDKRHHLSGYLTYDYPPHSVTSLTLHRSILINSVIANFATFLGDEKIIHRSFENDGIEKHLVQAPGNIFDYKIVEMGMELS